MFGRSGTTLAEAIVPLLLLAGFCAAGDPDTPPDLLRHSSATPNESVSLKPDGISDEETHVVATISPDQAALLTDAPKTPPGMRAENRATRLRGLVRSPSETSRRSAGPTPWYQTGLGSLGAVLVLVVVAAWAVRRWLPAARVGESGILHIAARANLSPKQSVALIRLGNRFVLVSVGGDHVSPLCEVAEPEEVADLAARIAASGGRPAEAFDGLLQKESADYEHVADSGDGDPAKRAASPRVVRGRAALSDLLNRLRTLQSD